MADRETLDVYRERAGDYAKRFASEGKIGRHLQAFLDEVPKGGRVLDLGCGPGDALAGMVSSGFDAEGLDASPEFAEMARMRSGANVRLAEFADLDDVEAFDGIYANFSLLHAPKSDMPDHLRQIASALKPGGIFHLGTKTGDGERRDGLGRFYAFYSEDELDGLLADAGFDVISRDFGEEVGLGGTKDPWIILLARKA